MDISIIVPVYNCEKYLKKCVYSILCQTHKNIEIILIDDGSTDKSGDMCDGFAEKDPRVKVIHQENNGVSHARNKGLTEAQGQTIIFVDSDDYVSSSLCEKLWKLYLTYNLDICMYGIKNEYYDGDKVFKRIYNLPQNAIYDSVKSFESELIKLYGNYLFFSVCTKLYRRSLIFEKGLNFDENIYSGEDLIFNLKYISNCKRIATIGEALYTYRHFKRASLTQRFYKSRMDWAKEILETALNFLDKFDMSMDFYRKVYEKFLIYCICGVESIFFLSCKLTSKKKNSYVNDIMNIVNEKIKLADKNVGLKFNFYKAIFSLKIIWIVKVVSWFRLRIRVWIR